MVYLERPMFRARIAKLNPQYELQDQKCLVKHQIPHNKVKTKIVILKLEEAAHLSVTTDICGYMSTTDLSVTTNNPFMSSTVYFIDSDCICNLYMLNTVFLFSDHTWQNIAEIFQDILGNWNISVSHVIKQWQ